MVCILLLFVSFILIGSGQSRLICDLQEADGIQCECRDHEAFCEATRPVKFLLPDLRKNELTALQKRRREANPMINSIMLQSPRNESFLQSIPSDIFEKSMNFVKINIAYASLDILKKGSVTGSDILRKLTMSLCGISDLEQDAIDGLLNLQELDLSSNHIKTLRANGLRNLPSLRLLTIEGSEVEIIEPHAFIHLNGLEELNLKKNRLDRIDLLHFTGLRKIRELDLSFNEIRHIDDTAFSSLKTLKRIDLTGNRLVTIGAKVFRSMDNLEFLSLNYNSITSLVDGFLGESQKLKTLNLGRNHLQTFHDSYLEGLNPIRSDFVLDIRANPLNCSCDLFFLNELRRQRLSTEMNEFGDPPEFYNLQCRIIIGAYVEPRPFDAYISGAEGCANKVEIRKHESNIIDDVTVVLKHKSEQPPAEPESLDESTEIPFIFKLSLGLFLVVTFMTGYCHCRRR